MDEFGSEVEEDELMSEERLFANAEFAKNERFFACLLTAAFEVRRCWFCWLLENPGSV